MATKQANVKAIEIVEERRGSENGGLAAITFDLLGLAYTGGTDTVQLGGGGQDESQTTALTLQQIMQNRRRDGKTVTIISAMGGTYGSQAAATNGPKIFTQSVAVSSGNVTLNLFSALTGGSAITTTTASWDTPAEIFVLYTAV